MPNNEPPAAAAAPAYRTSQKPPTSVDISGDDKVNNWQCHKERWSTFERLAGLDKERVYQNLRKDEFLYSLGPKTHMIYKNLNSKPTDKVDDIIKLLDEYVMGETHEAMEHYKFNQCVQKSKQTFDEWLAECRNLLKYCNYNNLEKEEVESTMLRDQIIFGIKDKEIQKKMLEERDADLKRVIDIARSCESATHHMKTVSGSASEEVNKVKANYKRKSQGRQSNSASTRSSASQEKECKFCMGTHVMKKECCPAWGKFCKECRSRNHFKG